MALSLMRGYKGSWLFKRQKSRRHFFVVLVCSFGRHNAVKFSKVKAVMTCNLCAMAHVEEAVLCPLPICICRLDVSRSCLSSCISIKHCRGIFISSENQVLQPQMLMHENSFRSAPLIGIGTSQTI